MEARLFRIIVATLWQNGELQKKKSQVSTQSRLGMDRRTWLHKHWSRSR